MPRARRAKKSKWGTRGKIYGRAAGQLVKDVYKLKELVNAEYKYLDQTIAPNFNATGTFVLMNGMQVGDTASTRDGQSIKIAKIVYKFNVAASAVALANDCRFMLVIDHQSNGIAPPLNQIFQDVTYPHNSLGNIGNSKRFQILVDKRFTVVQTSDTQLRMFKGYIQKDFHTQYNQANAGTIADIQTNSLYAIFIGDGGANVATGAGYLRIRFIDN